MLSTKEMKGIFKTLQEYEEFHVAWSEACYLLNPTEKNKERLAHSRNVLAVLSGQKESEANEQ